MITHRHTNLFDSEAQTLVNTVNCVGVMGKGIAKEFKSRDAEMFAAYKKICSEKLLQPGLLWLWRRNTPWVLNFPTKQHWKGPSKIEWIEMGLVKFVDTYEEKGISSISFPKLGCGNGGLNWNDVLPMMEHYLNQVSIPVYIHDFDDAIRLPEHLIAWDAKVAVPSTLDEFSASISEFAQKDQSYSTSIMGEIDYSISIADGGNIVFKHKNGAVSVDHDELRGVWLSLQRGTITKKQAEWFDDELNGVLVDVLARLPYTKAFLVGQGREQELAVELLRNPNAQTPISDQESMFG